MEYGISNCAEKKVKTMHIRYSFKKVKAAVHSMKKINEYRNRISITTDFSQPWAQVKKY